MAPSGRINRSSASAYQETEAIKAILDKLLKVADELSVTPVLVNAVKKAVPIIGARSVQHYTELLWPATVELATELIARLNELSTIMQATPMNYY